MLDEAVSKAREALWKARRSSFCMSSNNDWLYLIAIAVAHLPKDALVHCTYWIFALRIPRPIECIKGSS